MARQNGFTLVELLAALVLVSILAAVVIPRLPVGSDFNDTLQARNLAGLLRLAQLRAMNDPQALRAGSDTDRCGVVAVTSEGVSLSAGCNNPTLLTNLTSPDPNLWLGAKLSVTSNETPPFTLQFGEVAADPDYLSKDSRLGRPYVNGARLTNTLQITLGGHTVLIEPEGYVHVAP
ncbi:prepilin-type N-terminal cleavage/methylation domain-containing protein [Oceanimonas marisflavi]|uniref:prepilin-type N-terminal cleavage/methylation domain-containing protein n=1 Tax=Oceanimonas marisflavi TaxID=2059724 RepID=UPI000D324F7F|nr:prepilin-type N-terminal cleavage/methylation domain-containing protein [Oceanimonas marisflavi]